MTNGLESKETKALSTGLSVPEPRHRTTEGSQFLLLAALVQVGELTVSEPQEDHEKLSQRAKLRLSLRTRSFQAIEPQHRTTVGSQFLLLVALDQVGELQVKDSQALEPQEDNEKLSQRTMLRLILRTRNFQVLEPQGEIVELNLPQTTLLSIFVPNILSKVQL